MLMKSDPAGKDPIPGYSVIARDLPKEDAICESLTSQSTHATLSFIRKNKDHPFFAYVPFNMPHLGVYASDSFKGKSRRGLLGDAMEEIDHSVGQIRQTIEKLGLTKNTLIIFSSDNGPWIRFQDTENHPNYGRPASMLVMPPHFEMARDRTGRVGTGYRESFAGPALSHPIPSITRQYP